MTVIDQPNALSHPRRLESAVDDAIRIPLSSGQQRLWFLDRMTPASPLYNIPHLIRLRGALNVAALRSSIEAVVARHESLRTTFGTIAGETSQMVRPARPIPLSVVDLSEMPDADREARLLALAREEAVRPFDLTTDLMLRVRLYRLRDEDHALMLVMHHIASDGWSAALFFHELGALYEAFSMGRPSPLSEPPIQYGDFASWQENHLRGETLERMLSFWKQQLVGAPSVLDLPADRSRPPVRSYRGDLLTVTYPRALLAGLKEFSRQHRVTLFMTLFSAFNVLLNRYTGQTDLLVGTPVAGRDRPEVEKLIGFFVNTLVLRTDLTDEPTFKELLARVRDTTLAAYEHQEVPFERLVEELQPERNLGFNPLCQVLFALQNTPPLSLNLPGLTTRIEPLHTGTAKFDLTLWASEEPDGLGVSCEFNTDLFERTTVRRFLQHLRVILESIIEDADRTVSRLPILAGDERAQILNGWNETRLDFARDKSVHGLFEEQARRTPDAVALIHEDQEITYRELDRRAEVVAGELRRVGIGPDVPVGFCANRSLEMMVGLLGILKAGGCYVPLDPTYPKDRLAHMLEDSRAPVLLTQNRFRDELAFQIPNLKVLCLESLSPPEDSPADIRESFSRAKDLAYIIYTSGSTGRPKGVMISHRNVLNFFAAMDRVLGSERGVWLAVTSISFDISVLELFWTLARGFKVVIHSDERDSSDRNNLKAGQRRSIPELLVRHGVSHMQCTPSLAGTLLLAPESHLALRRLGKLLLGGEALPVSLAQRLEPMVSCLLNLYGPTETTIWSACHPVVEVGNSVPIGRPLANTQIYILDQNLEPVPAGVPGEIFIGGEGVARGYLNRPELTAERFVRNPFSTEPDARIYRTGDRGRWRADGTIEFLGRVDFQVKIRGHRIELGEIESTLGRHPDVQEVVTMAREDPPGDQRLVAYVVARPGAKPTAGELRQFAKSRLPEAMVPSAYVLLDALPLTPNGKVNRKVLPAPSNERPMLETQYIAPRRGLEEDIANIWHEVLHVGKAGLHDNFFDLGGHSLLVAEVQARLQSLLGREVPMVKLFQYPTISSLTEFLGGNGTVPADEFRDRGLRKQSVSHAQRKRPAATIS